ncbi:MAG: sigma-70 family RNA polymerase sigma factor [Pyrinomonadaceae bacterium]
MILRSEKYKSVIDESCGRLIARASNSRGLNAPKITARVAASVEKYLCRDDCVPETTEVRRFIDEMRADDLCLVIACENGDETAWEELVAAFDPTVKSSARKICDSGEHADDLAGSIWAELYGLRHDKAGNRKSKLAYYSGRGSLAGWLRAVVGQLAVDQFRKDARTVQIDEPHEFENLLAESSNHSSNNRLGSNDVNPEELLGKAEANSDVSSALIDAISNLEPEDKLILKLYYFDGLKLKDIARTFGYHEATASRKLARLHSEIRKAVEQALRTKHGWGESEIKRHLSDAAAQLGVSLEKMFTILMIVALMQDLYFLGVQ